VRARLLILLAPAAFWLAAVPAVAAPPCTPAPPTATPLLRGQGTLESVIADPRGPLYFTSDDAVMRLDSPNGQPRELAPVPEPGGLAFDDDGSLIVGTGNSVQNGQVGDQTGPSGLLRIDPRTGATETFATGLSMANGLVRGPDGSFYASNDFGSNIDRVRNGVTQRGWATVESGNGLAIDKAGRYLYAAQTFRPAAIRRVALDDPTDVTDYVVADSGDTSAGLDGMTRDAADNLFVTANGAGEIWRVSPDPAAICLLLDGLAPFPDGPSAVATGAGGAFPPENVYVVTFAGDVIEIQDVAQGRPPRIRMSVRPRRATVGDPTSIRFTTTVPVAGARVPFAGAHVRFAGDVVTTDRKGRAGIEVTFARPDAHHPRARLRGYRGDRGLVRALP
jgi:hypothetical protein